MSAAKMTPWFPPEVKPVHNGDYQVVPRLVGERRWSYWNGSMWSYFTLTQKGLDGNRDDAMHPAEMQWRGLASKPAEATK